MDTLDLGCSPRGCDALPEGLRPAARGVSGTAQAVRSGHPRLWNWDVLVSSKNFAALVVVLTLITVGGCRPSADPDSPATTTVQSQPPAPVSSEPQAYEASLEQLLDARLPRDQAAQGWVRLFDGHTLLGWEIAGAANWRIEDQSIVVDAGEPSLLCTAMPWFDYELELEFQAETSTNSGVFLRTPLEPQDPAVECYEVNIAPADNPFPTGSVVKRQKTDGVATTGTWQTMNARLEGNRLTVAIDGKVVTEYVDELSLVSGRIGLQHNSGRIAFRNVRIKPAGWVDLIDQELTSWTRYPEMEGEFSVNEDGELRVLGGKTQLETKESFGNFALLAEYRLPADDINTGIFFRSIPGDEMMGYECQVNDGIQDGNRLQPADCGTGGIFRRQDARVVAGDTGQWNTVMLKVHGPRMAAWVNGVQVSDWYDDRKPNENPRRGKRLEPGTVIIQGHDPGTDATFRQFRVASRDE